MARKQPPQPDVPSDQPRSDTAASGSGRDLVILYSRLVHTLENACDKKGAGGRDALAARFADLRRTGEPFDPASGATAFSRAFRRLGMIDDKTSVAAFVRDLSANVGQAVTREPEQVLRMFAMFCLGDDTLSLKPVCGATPLCHECLLTRQCEHYNHPRVPAMALLTPAARLLSGNDQALSDAELLAVLLFGDKTTGQEPLVGTLLDRYGRLRALFRAEAREYAGVRDMGKAQALRLAAVNALHKRLLAERRNEVLRITSAQDIHDRYAAELREYQTEAAVVLLLDQRNSVIRDAWFCDNSANIAHLNIADLLRPAVRDYAVRIALVHNHPSNLATPSRDDVDFTRRLRTACDMIGIGLVDHVIVTEHGYYSFAEEGGLGI